MSRLKQRAMVERDQTIRPVVLGDLREQGIDVQCWCNRCPHHAILPTEMLLVRFGAGYAVPEIGVHLRCSGCGSKDIATRPNWASLGLVARHISL
ncbi:MAG: hypothetical protein VW644_07085 [Alphaproteobacteria bacterium]